MNHNVSETTFPERQYLALKHDIPISEVTNKEMYDQAGRKLFGYIGSKGLKPVGPWSVIYFTWNEPEGRTSMAISVPIERVESVDDPELSIVEIPESKASQATLKGNYDGLYGLHTTLMNHVTENKIATGVAIEEYTVGPESEKDPANWVTNVYYLHE